MISLVAICYLVSSGIFFYLDIDLKTNTRQDKHRYWSCLVSWQHNFRDFDLLDPIGIEDLDHLDDQEKMEAGLKQGCSEEVFHTVRPMIYENTERAPGKSRYTKQKVVLQGNFEVSSVASAKEVENIVMNMKISSGQQKLLYVEMAYIYCAP